MIPSEFYKFVKAQNKRFQMEQKLEQHRTAQICATIANFVPMRSKKGKTFKPDDFMPKEKKKPQTAEQMLKIVEMMNKALGGEDKRKMGE